LFVGRLEGALAERGVQSGARVVWLPAGALGLLPLGLARDSAGEAPLMEKYELVSVPSLEALMQAVRQAAQATTPSLAAAVNPTGEDPSLTLPFTEIEGAIVASHFPALGTVIVDKSTATPRATLAALAGKTYWHFSTHGAFNWEDARQSGLMMRQGETLTVGALLDAEGRLARPRLVVLSACETGLYDTSHNADEFIGLPATFMQLGAAGVLATLWQVDDLATSLLMAKFYDLHLGQGMSPPSALKGAQSWLRGATTPELIAYGKAAAAKAKLEASKLAELDAAFGLQRRTKLARFAATWDNLHKRSITSDGAPASLGSVPTYATRPFAHPYYWGGFMYVGL
jgi:CHAT domain-containing protein